MLLRVLGSFSIFVSLSYFGFYPHALADDAASAKNTYFFVDIRDVAQFENRPEANLLMDSMMNHPEVYFPAGVSFPKDGGTQLQQKNSVYGVEILKVVNQMADGSVELLLGALFQSDTLNGAGGLFIRKMQVLISTKGTPAPVDVENVTVVQDTPLSNMKFDLLLGQTQRKLIVKTSDADFEIIYPVGVGGFDDGGDAQNPTKFLTPLYTQGSISRRNIMEARGANYRNMPFNRVSNDRGQYTDVGIHIYQLANGPEFLRGFISHGCIHLREKDLYEFTTLLEFGADPVTPLHILATLNVPEDHPFPLQNDRYKRVIYPITYDNEGLFRLEDVRLPPPFDRIMGALENVVPNAN